MKKSKVTRSLLAACSIVALSAVMYGCVHSGGDDTPPPVVDPEPTAYEAGAAAIAAATTAEAAQAAYDAVDQTAISGGEAQRLQMALANKLEMLATASRGAAQKMALSDAAGMIDTSDLSTAEDITAANAAIAALKAALAAATDVSDADKAMYQGQVTAAEAAVMTAQSALDTQGRMMVQREAISSAVTAARTAVGAVDDDASDAEVTAADDAITALRAAIAGAADLPEGDAAVATGQGTLDTLVIQLASAKESRQMAMEDADAEQRMATINAAKGVLSDAEAALAALADDATDQQKLDAQRMVESAANALRDALRMNGGSDADIEAAIRTSAAAKVAADALQATITAAAQAEEKRKMDAINTAQTALTGAEDALAELGEDATDKETRDAHRAVENAAAALIQVLEDNDGTADQISAATMKRDSAKMMADDLTSPIEIADQRMAITDALMTLATAVAAVDDEATDAEVKAADDAIADARKAIADATELPEAEKRAHGLLVDAHVSTLASAKASRQIVVDKKAEEKREMAKAASNKVALSKKAAIEAEGEALPDPTTAANRPFDRTDTDGAYAALADGETANTNDGRNYRVQVEHDGGAKVTITDGNLEAKNDPMFAKMATFGDGQMLVRNNGKMREIIVVHTDIEAPDNIAFSQAPGIMLDADTDPDYTGPESIAIDSTAHPEGGHTDNHHDGMMSSRFMHSGDAATATITFLAAADGPPVVKASEFSGTYDGATGTYKCTGTSDCTVTVNKKNEVTAASAGWQFTPAAGATVKVPDSDYMNYGFWLKTTTKDGAITSYDAVQTFASSSLTATPAADLEAVAGSATYDGDAAGVYVHETKNEDGTTDTATSGRFTADVSMTAHFAGNALKAEDTIEGTISNFDLDGGPANSWNVNLSATTIAADGGFTGNASGMTGDNGSLSGQFRGEAALDTSTDVADDRLAPPVVIGEFNSSFMNGAVAGAYGARKTDD